MNTTKRFTNGVLVEHIVNGVSVETSNDVVVRLGTPRYKSNCIDPKTGQLKPDSECAKKQQREQPL